MKKYRSGEQVKKGVYLNRETGEIINLLKSGGSLPGHGDTVYNRVPVAAMLIFGPFVGMVYVMFIPFIAFGMLLWYGIERLVQALSPVQEGVMGIVSPAWSPAEAHLDGKVKAASGKTGEEGDETPGQDKDQKLGGLLSHLEEEIDRKRKEK